MAVFMQTTARGSKGLHVHFDPLTAPMDVLDLLLSLSTYPLKLERMG